METPLMSLTILDAGIAALRASMAEHTAAQAFCPDNCTFGYRLDVPGAGIDPRTGHLEAVPCARCGGTGFVERQLSLFETHVTPGVSQ
jgi:hypothetical protein